MTAKGALSAPDLSLTVTSDRIEAMQREITGLTLTATGKADLANPAADVTLSGTLAGQSLDGKASLSTVSGRREIKGLSLALGQNRVSGDLVLDQNFRPLGTLDFAFADIAPLAAMANQTAQGDMNGTIRFAEAGGTPEIALDGKASAITREDLSVQDVSISAVVANYLATPAISGRVQAATLTAGKTVVRDIDVALRRDGVWTGFDGGAIVSGIPARAAGRLQIADGGVAIELSSGEAALQDFKATLAQPSTIRIAGGTATLDALTLEVAGGTAVLSGAAGRARPDRDILGAAGRRAADLRRLRQPDQPDHKIRLGACDGERPPNPGSTSRPCCRRSRPIRPVSTTSLSRCIPIRSTSETEPAP